MEKSTLEIVTPPGARDSKFHSINHSFLTNYKPDNTPHCASAGNIRDNIVDMDLWSHETYYLLFRTCRGPVTQRNYLECSSCTSSPQPIPQRVYTSLPIQEELVDGVSWERIQVKNKSSKTYVLPPPEPT